MGNPLTRSAVVAAASFMAVAVAACGTTDGGAADASIDQLEIIVPADPGGGWDQTGRAMQQVLQDLDLVSSAQVVNVPGAGGTVGLAQLANERDPETLMVMGLVMVGAIETNQSQATLADTTPISRLTEEPLVVVVPADSPYQDINDLVDDIKARGQSVSVTGGSAGGADHILAGLLLREAGVAANEVASQLNYVPYSGGGESLAALLGKKVDAGISGVGEYAEQVKAGRLRALAVSGAVPSAALPDVPTITDSGIDVVLTNWRGVVAPGTVEGEEADRLVDLVTAMAESDNWQETLETNNWADAFMAANEYGEFLESEVGTVRATLQDIGLVQ
ncbi:MAG TPA: tripartite tricarboxylate transporter substrate-binding protein [Jiangellaceae bacterium]